MFPTSTPPFSAWEILASELKNRARAPGALDLADRKLEGCLHSDTSVSKLIQHQWPPCWCRCPPEPYNKQTHQTPQNGRANAVEERREVRCYLPRVANRTALDFRFKHFEPYSLGLRRAGSLARVVDRLPRAHQIAELRNTQAARFLQGAPATLLPGFHVLRNAFTTVGPAPSPKTHPQVEYALALVPARAAGSSSSVGPYSACLKPW